MVGNGTEETRKKIGQRRMTLYGGEEWVGDG